MNNKLKVLIAALSLTIGSLAMAAEDSSRLYGFASVHQSTIGVDLALATVGTSTTTIDDKSTGFHAGVGYRVDDVISLELGYLDMGEATYSISDGTTTETVTAAYSGFTIGAVASQSFNDSFDVFVKGGLFIASQDITQDASSTITISELDDSGAYVGIGGEYQLTHEFLLYADYTKYFKNEFTTISGGIKFDF